MSSRPLLLPSPSCRTNTGVSNSPLSSPHIFSHPTSPFFSPCLHCHPHLPCALPIPSSPLLPSTCSQSLQDSAKLHPGASLFSWEQVGPAGCPAARSAPALGTLVLLGQPCFRWGSDISRKSLRPVRWWPQGLPAPCRIEGVWEGLSLPRILGRK